jgi:hypothetical protein
MKKENFNENEWKTAEVLIGKKNKNLIDYDCINYVNVGNDNYVIFMMEYANAGV